MTAVALDFARPHVLRNEDEYEAAVTEVDALAIANPADGTEAYDRLVFLAVLIEAYERDHDPIEDDVTPQEVVAFMLEQQGMTRADLHEALGGRSRVSEFFTGKRRLSIPQIKRLRELLRVPVELLIA